MRAVCAEIMILPLFAVRNDRRTCGFKPFNGVSNGTFIQRSEVGILTVAFCDSLDEINGSRDTADWLGRYRDWRRLGHTYRLARKYSRPHPFRIQRDFGVVIVTRRTRTMMRMLLIIDPGSSATVPLPDYGRFSPSPIP